MPIEGERPLIGVVGVCGSGKTTLINLLRASGLNLRHIAQEHSYVKDMWCRITNPDVLVYLDASYAETIRRRHLDWTLQEYEEQLRRLAHARQFADLYLFTDLLTPEKTAELILAYLKQRGILPNPPLS